MQPNPKPQAPAAPAIRKVVCPCCGGVPESSFFNVRCSNCAGRGYIVTETQS